MPSSSPVRYRFGSWSKGLKAAGLVPKKPMFSDKCREASRVAHTGKTGCNWKGGRIKDQFGYILLYLPEHPRGKSNGYVHEHRIIMEKQIGRYLKKTESVHHKNCIKDDNRIENLELMQHRVHHGSVICPHCGKEFRIR